LQDEPTVEVQLSLDEAGTVHALLEDFLESGEQDRRLERTYRLLGWRILAVRGGTGLTRRVADLASEADSLEEYEAAREELLGPVLDGLERGENRDP